MIIIKNGHSICYNEKFLCFIIINFFNITETDEIKLSRTKFTKKQLQNNKPFRYPKKIIDGAMYKGNFSAVIWEINYIIRDLKKEFYKNKIDFKKLVNAYTRHRNN